MNDKLDEVDDSSEAEWRPGEAAESVTNDDMPSRARVAGQAPCRSAGKVKPNVERFVDDG